ncbi:MAG TPA: hypothetical protein VL633_03090 [Bacteroidota bacterium]|nr:hypothetical protein [Bacteroidota bacterium]
MSLIDSVEQASGKKFTFRSEIGLLHDVAQKEGRARDFEDITFYAKFIHHASGILQRFGASGEETVKLSAEFKEKLQTVTGLLLSLVKQAPEPDQSEFVKRFFSPTPDSMNNLLSLLRELSWIKNYSLDQRQSP